LEQTHLDQREQHDRTHQVVVGAVDEAGARVDTDRGDGLIGLRNLKIAAHRCFLP
jgi:hypothetical protein